MAEINILSRLFPPKGRNLKNNKDEGVSGDFSLEEDAADHLLIMDLMENKTNHHGRRTTDRSDSSESSDSGVATLSPSTSDSTELISSPYSPSSSTSSSETSETPSYSSPSPPPIPILLLLPPPPPTSTTSLLAHPIMTAVSAVLASASASSEKKPPASSSFLAAYTKVCPLPVPPSTTKGGPPPMNILAAALSFHQQQQKQLLQANNNNVHYNEEEEECPSKKKARLDEVSSSKSSKLVTVTTIKIEEEEGRTTTIGVEAMVVQNGRVCSVQESLTVKVPPVKGGCGGCCMWKACHATDPATNLLEHIQTVHVSLQTKGEGYVCLWEGCKVYNVKSSSLSWLERHILSHSGTKPFKCFIPGCGQSFGVRGALERHVNSHMSLGDSSLPNRKLDSSSPLKSSRRKKPRCRKQRLNIGQYVDYFDKRVMEVIKDRLAASLNSSALSHTHPHHCTFQGQVVAKHVTEGKEPTVLVQWEPSFIIPDEWMPLREFKVIKRVPLPSIPKHKLPLLFPSLFPQQPPRAEGVRQGRKWTISSSSSSSSSSASTSSSSPSPSDPPPPQEEEEDNDDDWAVNLLLDNMLLS